jgi:metal-sulfur cluster biosynthetic enzyme
MSAMAASWASFTADTKLPTDRLAEVELIYTAGFTDAMHLIACKLADGADGCDLAEFLVREIKTITAEAAR